MYAAIFVLFSFSLHGMLGFLYATKTIDFHNLLEHLHSLQGAWSSHELSLPLEIWVLRLLTIIKGVLGNSDQNSWVNCHGAVIFIHGSLFNISSNHSHVFYNFE